MPYAPLDAHPHEAAPAWKGRDRLPQRVYRFRVLGLGLSGLPIAVGLWEQQAAWPLWAAMLFSTFLWPHVAWWRARSSRDPYRTEIDNLIADSVQSGFYAGVLQFNPLVSALLLTIATMDKINSGVRGLWLRSIPGLVLGLLVGAVITGFRVNLETSLPLVLACLPILIIHTTAVSLNGAALMRRVHLQNKRLDEIGRVDSLTGVSRRGYWEMQAAEILALARAQGTPASLLLLDVDRFKNINDVHGHAAGDELLRAVGGVLARVFAGQGQCGRIGGDEFVVACQLDRERAADLADALRGALLAVELPGLPGLRCSVSCGIAELTEDIGDLQAWMVAADRAMYNAKRASRAATG